MVEPREERRLAAVLAADMVGYSRLMEANESGTIERQKTHRRELIDPTIAEHRGRIVKTTGDGMLVEFASAIDAVRCAVEIQRGMVEREAGSAEDTRIEYRIGINVGDIIIDDNDIFEEGVNIAARLEELADPCGVYVSDTVHQSIASKLDLTFDDLGLQSVKNIVKPVHVWRWSDNPQPADSGSANSKDVLAEQEIRFCVADDGTQIAYATVGAGPPLVKAQNWMNHLEYDWKSPVWRAPDVRTR